MAVHRRGYRRYQGPLTGRWSRLMVTPRFAWQRLSEQRLVVLFLAVSMIWPLLCAGFVYVACGTSCRLRPTHPVPVHSWNTGTKINRIAKSF